MKKSKRFTFIYNVNGQLKQVHGYGISQLLAENNAITHIKQSMNIKNNNIKFVRVVNEENTEEWI